MNWKFWKDEDGTPMLKIDVGAFHEQGDELNEHSATWKTVKRYAEQEIQNLREANDSTTADETRTAVIRGRIAALKDVIDLPHAKQGGLLNLRNDE